MRSLKTLGILAGVLAVSAGFDAAVAGTTRIETRPFYGAVVTIEEGVRVFRPLPSTDRVIVNPHGRTPLSLGFNETYVTERNYNYNYSDGNDDSATDRAPYLGGYYGLGHGRGHKGKRGGHGIGGLPGGSGPIGHGFGGGKH